MLYDTNTQDPYWKVTTAPQNHDKRKRNLYFHIKLELWRVPRILAQIATPTIRKAMSQGIHSI